jgi:hypothetical protein
MNLKLKIVLLQLRSYSHLEQWQVLFALGSTPVQGTLIYIVRKASLFCLFVKVKSFKLQCLPSHFLYVKKPSMLGVHQGGLVMFKPMEQTYMNIE